MRAMESTRKKLEAPEEKRFWRTSAPEVMTSSEAHFIRSFEDHQKVKEVKLQKAV